MNEKYDLTNESNLNRTKIFNLYYILLIIGITNSAGFKIGRIAVFLVMLVSVIYLVDLILKNKRINSLSLKITVLAIFMVVIQTIGLLNNNNTRAYITIAQFIGIIATLIVCIEYMDINKINFKYYKKITAIVGILLYTQVILSELGFNLRILYANKNSLAIISQIMIYMNLMLYAFKKINFKYVVIFIISLVISDGRGAIISIIITLFTIFSWNNISKLRISHVIYFVIILCGIIGFTFIYPHLNQFEWFNSLDQLSLDIFGKNLYSGRESIWKTIIELTKGNRIIGLGTGVFPSDFFDWGGSAHNQYIDILFQNGILGISLVFSIFFSIWVYLFRYRLLKPTKIIAGILVGVMICNLFEVILFQNHIALGNMFWFIIATGISSLKRSVD